MGVKRTPSKLISNGNQATTTSDGYICLAILEGKSLQRPDIAAMQRVVTHFSDQEASPSLAGLGWSTFFADQLSPEETSLARIRISAVHRSMLTAVSEVGPVRLSLPSNANIAEFAVGDWGLIDPATHMLVRRLDRRTLLQRRTEGGRSPQLIAANVDTLFIVTSCNDDFNPARLERYLVFANESGAKPVVVLTKIDQTEDTAPYVEQASALQRGLAVVMLNAKAPGAARTLAEWARPGQTVALVGSSGVGKSTLLNALSSKQPEDAQLTGSVREADAKGRHTTTSRSLHEIDGGGWVIDTPGLRSLQISDASEGLDMLFAEIVELAPKCHFRNCTHDHEPGCAVQSAIAAGTLDAARLDRWRKLTTENQTSTPVLSGARGNKIPKATGNRR